MSGPDPTELVELARRWASADPDPATRAELTAAADGADPARLVALVGERLHFGTAGLRGPLGPGPARMNRAVVRRVAAALARDLRYTADPRGPGAGDRPDVVVAHDARHGSEVFATDLVEVLVAHGLAVVHVQGPAPTPLLARAVLDLGTRAGVMVTASHNPAGDNGLKVYAHDGAQIVPPADGRIEALLAAQAPDADPMSGAAPAPGRQVVVGGTDSDDPLVLRYLDRVVAPASGGLHGPLRVAHTSLHGVGHTLLVRALGRVAGLEQVEVAEQAQPDPDFPTVTSPNPEEPGTLDLLVRTAIDEHADVALALDPDADRLAVALPRHDGGDAPTWHQLSGDELGALLAADLIEQAGDVRDPLVVTTIVSSRLVPTMCAALGVHHVETLTGFKWLCRPALAHPDWHQLLAYEEALGYAVGPDARDKDGIAAAVALLCAVDRLRARGSTAWQRLDDLARVHGVHATHNTSTPLGPGLHVPAALGRVAALRELSGIAVVGVDRPAPDVVRLVLADRTRVVVRPSGTEPKLKCYVEAVLEVPPGAELAALRRVAGRSAERVGRALQLVLER